jgi:cobalamin biosynthesis Mg chelatase CobN
MDNEKADKIIELLSDIKMLQQKHIENYGRAVKNQEESIAMQKSAVGRYRKIVFPAILIVIVLVFVALAMVLFILRRYF